MSYVGHRYDLHIGDKPLRIVVVGQEAKDSKLSLARRYEQIRESAQLPNLDAPYLQIVRQTLTEALRRS